MPKSLYIRYAVVFLLVMVLAAFLVESLLARPATRVNPRLEDPNEIVDANLIFVVSNDSPFEQTSNCKQCHRSITEEWYDSMLYFAWRDPLFQEAYEDYIYFLESPEPSPAFIPIVEADEAKARERPGKRKERERPPEEPFKVELNVLQVREDVIGQELHGDGKLLPEGIVDNKMQTNCIKCHSPAADFTMDGDMVLESNNEGVFCDYCHLIVDRSEEGYLIFPLCKIKQGPYMEPVTASHPVEYSSLHTMSEFCSQDCHMPSYRGRASASGDVRENVKSHYFAGGHSRGFMIDAAICDIGEVEITEQEDASGGVGAYNLTIPIDVINERAGHDFPTGWPLRQMILVVRLKSEDYYGVYSEKKIIYEKVYGDFWGNRSFNMWEITQVLTDNETWDEEGIPRGIGPLKAGETRVEDINLVLDAAEYDEFEDGDLYVTAQLFYRLTPEGYSAIADLPSAFRIHADVEYVMLP